MFQPVWIFFSQSSWKVSQLVVKLLQQWSVGPTWHFNFFSRGNCALKWLEYVHSTLDSLGMSYVWQTIDNPTYTLSRFKVEIKRRITDQFLQKWHNDIHDCNTSIIYRMYKTEFKFEKYLTILPSNLKRKMTQFRLSSHKLPVQRLRYFDVPRHERLCTLCDKQEMGDEYHYLFSCTYQPIQDKRRLMISRRIYHHHNIFKFQSLMNIKAKSKLKKLAIFITEILNQCR